MYTAEKKRAQGVIDMLAADLKEANELGEPTWAQPCRASLEWCVARLRASLETRIAVLRSDLELAIPAGEAAENARRLWDQALAVQQLAKSAKNWATASDRKSLLALRDDLDFADALEQVRKREYDDAKAQADAAFSKLAKIPEYDGRTGAENIAAGIAHHVARRYTPTGKDPGKDETPWLPVFFVRERKAYELRALDVPGKGSPDLPPLSRLDAYLQSVLLGVESKRHAAAKAAQKAAAELSA